MTADKYTVINPFSTSTHSLLLPDNQVYMEIVSPSTTVSLWSADEANLKDYLGTVTKNVFEKNVEKK